MTRILAAPDAGGTVVDSLRTYQGGTGVKTAADARTYMDLISASSLDQANGVASLDASGNLNGGALDFSNLPAIALLGSLKPVIGVTTSYFITNYDIFTTYNVTAVNGTVTRNGDTLTFTGTSVGNGAIKINGRTYSLTVIPIQPLEPTLSLSSRPGASNTAIIDSAASAFQMNATSAATHLNSDWQISTDSNFTNILGQSLADSVNKVSWSYPGLNLNTQYYVRVKYRASDNSTSDWVVSSHLTKQVYLPYQEIALLQSDVPTSGEQFGYAQDGRSAVSVDDTGNRVVIGTGKIGTSYIYVFVRTSTGWSLEQKIADTGGSNGFAQARTSITGDGSRIAVGCPNYSSSTGRTYIYVRSGSTWTLEATISGVSQVTGDKFGDSVSIDKIGNRVVIGAPFRMNSSATYSVGAVYIYSRSGSAWTLETSFSSNGSVGQSVSANTESFGYCIKSDYDCTRVVISNFNDDVGIKAFIYKRTNVSWAKESTLVPSWSALGATLNCCAIDNDGTRVLVGDRNTACVGVFMRSGTSWSQEATILGTTVTSGNSSFGAMVEISKFGDSIFVGYPTGNASNTLSGSSPWNTGAVAVYKRNGSTWSLSHKLQASTPTPGEYFGGSIANSADGTYLFVGIQSRTVSGMTSAGQVAVLGP